jgi:hypothetical protein
MNDPEQNGRKHASNLTRCKLTPKRNYDFLDITLVFCHTFEELVDSCYAFVMIFVSHVCKSKGSCRPFVGIVQKFHYYLLTIDRGFVTVTNSRRVFKT